MAKTPNFTDVLDTPSTEVAPPKLPPQGTYAAMVKGLYNDGKYSTGTEYSEYTLQLQEAMDDVDPDNLKAALTKANGDVIPITQLSVKARYSHTEDSLFILKQFLDHLQIPDKEDDGKVRTIKQRMQDVPGKMLLVHIKHNPSQDGTRMFANIDKTGKYE